MPNQKGVTSLILILGVLVILGILGGSLYYSRQNPNQNLTSHTPINKISTPQASILNNSEVMSPQPSANNMTVAQFVTLDKQNNPVRPDKAWWYYPPVDGKAEEFPAKCVNADCTKWAVFGPVNGQKIYVGASYTQKYIDPSCMYSAYDAGPINLSTGESPEVKLILEKHLLCE